MDKLEQYKIKFALDNRTWSFSSVNCYKNCPRCFYLSYLKDPPIEKVNNAFAQWGTLGHSLFERYVDGALELYELGDTYEKEYYTQVTLAFPPNKYVDLNASYHDKGLEYFENFDGFPENWELIESETEVRLGIDGVKFVGYIDLIVRDRNTGKYIVVDHKSKSKFKDEKEEAEYARQLYLYSLYIKEKYSEYPSHLIFNMFRSNNIVIIKFSKESLNDAKNWFKNTVETIKKDTKFADMVALDYEKKRKSLRDFKKDSFFCNYLCSCRKFCERSKDCIENK